METALLEKYTENSVSFLLKKTGLLIETNEKYEITQLGWYWYVNMMYYLTPGKQRKSLDKMIEERMSQPVRKEGSQRIILEETAQII